MVCMPCNTLQLLSGMTFPKTLVIDHVDLIIRLDRHQFYDLSNTALLELGLSPFIADDDDDII